VIKRDFIRGYFRLNLSGYIDCNYSSVLLSPFEKGGLRGIYPNKISPNLSFSKRGTE